MSVALLVDEVVYKQVAFSQLENCHKRILELESSGSRLEEDNERLQQDLDRLRSETGKVRNLYDSSQSTLTEARNEVGKLRSTIVRLEKENRELQSENQTLNERTTKETAKCEELEAEVRRLASNEKAISDKLGALQLEIQTLTREKQSAIRERQLLQARMEQVCAWAALGGSEPYVPYFSLMANVAICGSRETRPNLRYVDCKNRSTCCCMTRWNSAKNGTVSATLFRLTAVSSSCLFAFSASQSFGTAERRNEGIRGAAS